MSSPATEIGRGLRRSLAAVTLLVAGCQSYAERLGMQGRRDIAPLSWAGVVKKLVMT